MQCVKWKCRRTLLRQILQGQILLKTIKYPSCAVFFFFFPFFFFFLKQISVRKKLLLTILTTFLLTGFTGYDESSCCVLGFCVWRNNFHSPGHFFVFRGFKSHNRLKFWLLDHLLLVQWPTAEECSLLIQTLEQKRAGGMGGQWQPASKQDWNWYQPAESEGLRQLSPNTCSVMRLIRRMWWSLKTWCQTMLEQTDSLTNVTV